MTQPPPPPNQPPGPPPGTPQGGFGAPQDPPPGGFGAPTPPPAQPPYGYPQQPQQPHQQPQQPPQPPAQPPTQPVGQPGQQPPYGYPAQPPTQPMGQPAQQPQYGYPQQPQQPYGYPTQPQFQQAPPVPAAGGGKKLSAQMQIVIAAVVAVVLLIGGGLWYANSGDDGGKDDTAKGTSGGTGGDGGKDGGSAGIGGGGKEKPPANPKSKMAFQLQLPTVPDVTDLGGSWITDTAYVKTGVNSVVGYDLNKGTVLWTLPLTGQVCGTSRHTTADHKVPILFEATKRVAPRYYQPCTEVGLLDLTTGKLVWQTSVTGGNGGDAKVRFSEITLHDRTVAAGGLDGGAAFDVANGNVRWKPQPNADNCDDLGYGGGEGGLVAVRKCGSYDSPTVTIQNLDPMSGRPLAQFKMPSGVDYASVVSTKPLVVAADVGDTAGDGSNISDFFSIDEKTGKLKAKITADADRYAARCRSTKVEGCSQVLVGNGRLYVPTEEHEGSTGEYGDETNEIVAFDLATGQSAPEKADAGDRYTLMPLRMDGGNLIAYKWPPYDRGGQIVSIDGGTMKSTLLMENPGDKANRDAETSFSQTGAEFQYANGHFFVAETLVSKTTASTSSYGKRYLAVGFTTAG
ncbi:PQQ-binding-like beta-propeller repeat protein [Streptomyces sp. NPDC053493]|uniref:outer membrane protein assembly factor BamB family protein n=1 Tax=Streptomyces sp. NPDC053493 TaxID=3365705 RepID=UPI0037D16FEE